MRPGHDESGSDCSVVSDDLSSAFASVQDFSTTAATTTVGAASDNKDDSVPRFVATAFNDASSVEARHQPVQPNLRHHSQQEQCKEAGNLNGFSSIQIPDQDNFYPQAASRMQRSDYSALCKERPHHLSGLPVQQQHCSTDWAVKQPAVRRDQSDMRMTFNEVPRPSTRPPMFPANNPQKSFLAAAAESRRGTNLSPLPFQTLKPPHNSYIPNNSIGTPEAIQRVFVPFPGFTNQWPNRGNYLDTGVGFGGDPHQLSWWLKHSFQSHYQQSAAGHVANTYSPPTDWQPPQMSLAAAVDGERADDGCWVDPAKRPLYAVRPTASYHHCQMKQQQLTPQNIRPQFLEAHHRSLNQMRCSCCSWMGLASQDPPSAVAHGLTPAVTRTPQGTPHSWKNFPAAHERFHTDQTSRLEEKLPPSTQQDDSMLWPIPKQAVQCSSVGNSEVDVREQKVHGESKNLPRKAPRRGNESSRNARQQERDRPVKARTAYNFFFQDQRLKILSELGHTEKLMKGYHKSCESSSSDEDDSEDEEKNDRQAESAETRRALKSRMRRKRKREPHHKIKFSEMGKQIGKRWKELSVEGRRPYVKLALEDKQRYQQEMVNFSKKKGKA